MTHIKKCIFYKKISHLYIGIHTNLAFFAHLCGICPGISGHPGSITFFASILTKGTTSALVWCFLIVHSSSIFKILTPNECCSFSGPNGTKLTKMINIMFWIRSDSWSQFLGIYYKFKIIFRLYCFVRRKLVKR